ncbi:hypothetical protein ACIQYL_20855 [Lysinibacillus xylanilyticus]|uniref:hypothetical protein n=1 Tax=Lysinibacillus xylanilyticus TaxID=582475 RepID=UPI0038301AB4
MESVFNGISSKIADIVGGLIYAIFKSIIAPFADVYTLEELIFGTFKVKGDTVFWGTFSSTELAIGFLPLYHVMVGIAGCFMVTFIVIAGMRIASSSLSPSRRNETLEFTKEIILVGIGLFYLPEFYSFVFSINMAFVGLFNGITSDGVFSINLELDDGSSLSSDNGFIGKILIELVLFGLGIWANFYYLMRKVTLLILMSLGPLMLVFWMVPQLKPITGAWMKEFIGTVFVQTIHCFVFWTVAVVSLSNDSLVGTIIVYVLFIPISEQVKNLLGLGGGMTGALSKTGAMFGLSALAGVAGSIKGAMGDQSVTGALKGLRDGFKKRGSKGEDKGDGNDSGRDASEAKEASFANSKTSKMLKAGDVMSRMGKAVLGSAGAIAGAGLGPMGAIGLAEAGAKIGDLAGGVTGRVGAAAALGISDRVKGGKQSLDQLKKAREGNDESMANAVADQEASSWAEKNKDSVMSKLRENFPNATQADLDKKFGDIVTAKKEGFKADAKSNWQSAKGVAAGAGNGRALVDASASAMTEQWSKDNVEKFNDEYEKANPKQPGESDSAYMTRRANAFNNRQSQMRDNFLKDGNTFLAAKADSDGNLNRESLATFMGAKASSHKDSGDVSNLTSAATKGMEHVSGVAMFDQAGKPNKQMIATGLASARTEQMKNDYLKSTTSSGMSQEQAMNNWKAKEPGVMADNFAKYSSQGFESQVENSVVPAPTSKMQAIKQNTGAFINGAGWNGVKNAGNIVKAASVDGVTSLKGELAQGNVITGIPTAMNAAYTGGANEHISQHGGDAVKAQHALIQSAGHAGAVLLGRTGMAKAQSIMSRVTMASGYGNHVQTQISSVSEVMQMAQKVMDDNGHQVIAPGAIQQVTTRDGSYVQVKTTAGEVRTVSRIGAGSESLKQGERVYQDLTSSDGRSLEVANVGNSGVSTYQVDSGGGRIPVRHNVQNPMGLLGNVSTNEHAEVQRAVTPVLSQKVDAGTFHTEDLAAGVSNGSYKNVQVVIDKGQQYLTAESSGQTYRVSPISKGDARMGSNQSITIPVEVTPGGQILNSAGRVVENKPATISMINNQTTPDSGGQVYGVEGVMKSLAQQNVTQTVTENIINVNGEQAKRQVAQNKVNVLQADSGQPTDTVIHNVHQTVRSVNDQTNQQTQPYYNQGMNFNNLMSSRLREHAQRNVNRRTVLDRVRHKQGVV